MFDADDPPIEIHEQRGPMWLAVFSGGPMDGWVEVHDGTIARVVERRWYGFDRTRRPTVYRYRLVEPVTGGTIDYQLEGRADEQLPHDP